MSVIIQKALKTDGHGGKLNAMIERYDTVNEMVMDLKKRSITDGRFEDQSTKHIDESWSGVKSYSECIDYLHNGYQPTVDILKTALKPTSRGESKRIGFKNDIVGGMPIVPLAMMGIPNSMVNTYIRPIKAKVINIYYDMTCSCRTKSADIIDAGQKVLAAIMDIERRGYRCDLYAMQSYTDYQSADILAIKIKSSDKPLDIKRMSYALTHTSFFRIIGFDWYSKTPKAQYRFGYGQGLSYLYDHDIARTEKVTKQIFGDNSIYLSAAAMIKHKGGKDGYINLVMDPK